MDPVSSALEAGQGVEAVPSKAMEELSAKLQRALEANNEFVELVVGVQDWPHLVVVRRGRRSVRVVVDVQTRVEFLREQTGFYPEPASSKIVDIAGYAQPQFSMAVRGTDLRVRVPVVFQGRYLGDLGGVVKSCLEASP